MTARDVFLHEVLDGLSSSPKTLPSKYFYDERGSQLFDAICGLEEYYPTEADLDVTRRHVDDVAAAVGPRIRLIELGSGSSLKTRVLLDRLDVAEYVPIDISKAHLEKSVAALEARYPTLRIHPVGGDYTAPVALPDGEGHHRVVVYFPGSTIGNFHPPEAVAFLQRIRAAVAGDPDTGVAPGGLLVGVDLDKDPATLERAYDDALGITAAFNLNLLVRINRELDADFDVDGGFRHLARYDVDRCRIEMHLVSTRSQTVTVAGRAFAFDADETIRSEVSYKYGREAFARLAAEASMRVASFWTDARGLFSLQYLVPA